MVEGLKGEQTRTENITLLAWKVRNSKTTEWVFIPVVKGRSRNK